MATTVSNPFRVQVRTAVATAAPPARGSISDLAFEGKRALPSPFIDPQTGQRGSVMFGKHTNFQFCPDDGRIYGYGGDGVYVGTGNDSGTIRLVRLAFSAPPNLALTYDNPYPWWGIAGVPFPAGQDACPFIYDSTRGCFWIIGGFYQSGADTRNVGLNKRYGVWRFWTRGPLTGTYEQVVGYPGTGAPAPPANAPGEGMTGNYVPAIDCLIWMGTSVKRLYWYRCSDGATGSCDTSAYAESVSKYPGVGVGKEGVNVSGGQTAYDPVNNELIWHSWNGRDDFNGVYATRLNNWPGTLSTRQLYRDPAANISSIYGQQPTWIRGRKLYTVHTPHGYADAGFSLGILEIDLDVANPQSNARKASHPTFENPTSGFTLHPAWPLNAGAYDPVKDIFVGTPAQSGTAPFVFRWSPPSWTPAAGNVSAITTDLNGGAVNSMNSVIPPAGVYGATNRNPLAWASACYAKDVSTNGAMLINNGGDADYWGTEVYCFDFDTRRWSRLSDPTTAMSGRPGEDRARSPADPRYFNRGECEHGPDPTATTGWTASTTGLLPAGTTPGVPHNYDGVMYLPGSVVGNLRGALVRPHSQVVYNTDGTGRSHYFDLDYAQTGGRKGWGRFSANKAGPNQNPLISGQIPIIGYDKARGRVYHAYGHLDVATRLHTNRPWLNRSMETKGCFDPVRRLWLMPRFGGFGEGNSGAPGTLMACAVDSSSTFVELTFAFSAGSAAWLRGQAWQGGLEYFDELDCFFFYCCGTAGANSPTSAVPYATRQKIWKIQPPASNPLTNAWTVTEIAMPGVAVEAGGVQGTYGRFFRVAPLKCLAFYNGPGASGKIYLYKPQGL